MLKPAEESIDISVFSGSLLGAPDDQLMAGDFPAVAAADKVSQIGRPQGEHGAVTVFQHV